MLSILSLRKVFPAGAGEAPVVAIDGVDLEIGHGELFALLGPSGCGKTTILQSIAGLEIPDAGLIAIGDRVVVDTTAGRFTPVNERGLGMVFQSYAIWPHMSVFENVAFPLRHGTARTAADRIRPLVMAALERVRLAELADRAAPFLSGGQQQRVALARAIVHEPRLLLLDEPLSNLDARLRDEMRIELRQLVKGLGITTVFVTHDQTEAMGMADRIALLRSGKIAQCGTPEDLYFRPVSAFAANFVGHANLLHGRVVDVETAPDGPVTVFETAIGPIRSTQPCDLPRGSAGICVIRPGAVECGPGDGGHENRFAGRLVGPIFLGERVEATFIVGETPLNVTLNPYAVGDLSGTASISVPAARCVIVPEG